MLIKQILNNDVKLFRLNGSKSTTLYISTNQFFFLKNGKQILNNRLGALWRFFIFYKVAAAKLFCPSMGGWGYIV